MASMTTVAISGASGALGRQAAESFLEQGDPEQLLLLTRTPDKLADLAARGARIARASFRNPTGLKQVLAGVERLLLISTDAIGSRIDDHKQAIASARIAGVEHVIYTSILSPGADNPAMVAAEHAATEQALRESGMAWTLLRNSLYADGVAQTAVQAAQSGVWQHNAGEGATSWVARADCARAAAAVLATDGHEKEIYDITGPAAVTQSQAAEIAARLLGVEIEVEALSDADYAVALEAAGLPSPVVTLLLSFGEAVREGFLSKVTGDVEALTGRAPAPLEQVLAPLLTAFRSS